MLAYEEELIAVLRALNETGALRYCIISGSSLGGRGFGQP